MTSPFAFVPRAVSKYTKEWQGITRPPPSPSPPPNLTTDDEDEDESKGKGKAIEPTHSKQSTIPQDIAALVSLALSEYNIWYDHDLRWKLDACLQDDVSPDDAGFVPINYLLRRAPFRGALPLPNGHAEPSETEVVKALRAHATHMFEVRMRLPLPASSSTSSSATAPASSVWYGTGKTSRKKDVGGYEVRWRDWATLRHRLSRGWTRARWDDLTAYMECIPPQYRSVGGIARFTESLSETRADADAKPDTDVDPRSYVQCVTLPPHYLDKPGEAPKCKGYALVTFSTKSHLEAVLRAWPWRRRVSLPNSDASPFVKEAVKYGLRAISKVRWEALNEEYLAYKQTLVDQVAREETEAEPATSPQLDAESLTETKARSQTRTQMQTTHSSRYPPDCLVFVRNIHPDTNKTMLKSLFSQAFLDQDQGEDGIAWDEGLVATAGLDYVDFNKGTDACHLRLASPFHTAQLLAYFDAHPKAQMHGLDATGRTPLLYEKPIAFERVQGKKEELYWEEIPEKVRRQAVERVVRVLSRGAEVEALESSILATRQDGVGLRLKT